MPDDVDVSEESLVEMDWKQAMRAILEHMARDYRMGSGTGRCKMLWRAVVPMKLSDLGKEGSILYEMFTIGFTVLIQSRDRSTSVLRSLYKIAHRAFVKGRQFPHYRHATLPSRNFFFILNFLLLTSNCTWPILH